MKWNPNVLPIFLKAIEEKHWYGKAPYLCVEKTGLLCQILTGVYMVLPLYSWSTPSCVWLIALSKPGKPGCYTGITNSLGWKKRLCENSPEILSTCLCSGPSLPSCPTAAHFPLSWARTSVCVSRLWPSFVVQHPTLLIDKHTEIKLGTLQQCLPLKLLIKRKVPINF